MATKIKLYLYKDEQKLVDAINLVGVTYYNSDAVKFKVLRKLNGSKYLCRFDEREEDWDLDENKAYGDDGFIEDGFFEIEEEEICKEIARSLYLWLYDFTGKEYLDDGGSKADTIIPLHRIDNEHWLCRNKKTGETRKNHILKMYYNIWNYNNGWLEKQ